jgi:hypothetical protein
VLAFRVARLVVEPSRAVRPPVGLGLSAAVSSLVSPVPVSLVSLSPVSVNLVSVNPVARSLVRGSRSASSPGVPLVRPPS